MIKAEQRLYTPIEAAEFLRLSRTHVYRLIERGELDAIRIGRAVRVEGPDLSRFLETLRAGGETA